MTSQIPVLPAHSPRFHIPYAKICRMAGEVDTVERVLAGKAEKVNAPLPDQLRIVDALEQHREVVVVGGNALGKSHMLSRLLIALVLGRKGRRVVVTSVTEASLKEIIFANMSNFWQQLQHIAPNHHKTIKTLYPDKDNHQWFITGKVSRPGVEESFAGAHSQDEIVLLADEATNLDSSFFKAWDGLRKSGHSRLILFCNGLNTATPLYQFAKRREVHEIHWSALTHPNVIHQRILVPGAVSYEEVQRVIQQEGEKSYEFIVRIDGQWFESGSDNIIPIAFINKVLHDYKEPHDDIVAVGVDIARQGANKTKCYGFTDDGYGYLLWEVQGVPETDIGKGPDIANRIQKELEKPSVGVVVFDEDGMGATVGDFVTVPNDTLFIGYRSNDDCTDKQRHKRNKEAAKNAFIAVDEEEPRYVYANLATEIWWLQREHIQRQEIKLPDISQLHIELSTRLFGHNDKGEYLLQKKDKWMEEQNMLSCDDADGENMGFMAWLIHKGRLRY